MQFTLGLLLVLAVYAQAKSLVPEAAITSAYGYLERSIAIAKERIQAEEKYLAEQRIIGGAPAALGDAPYQASVLIDIIGLELGQGICGGSVLSANRVITAAHCWFDGLNQGYRVTVRVGSNHIGGNVGQVQQSTVVITHPEWFPALVRNDVAVIYFDRPFTFSNTVSPISLPTGSEVHEDFAGVVAWASGFGLETNNGGVSEQLNHVQLNVMTNSACSIFFVPTLVQPTNICTSGAGTVGACRGDSGGPLVWKKEDGRNMQIGIVSFGPPVFIGCQAGLPSVYARITSFLDFFNRHK